METCYRREQCPRQPNLSAPIITLKGRVTREQLIKNQRSLQRLNKEANHKKRIPSAILLGSFSQIEE